MALLRPSLTLVLDLDERVAAEQTILEINRSYAHIGTPVMRTHAPASEDAPVRNTARLIVNTAAMKLKKAEILDFIGKCQAGTEGKEC